MGISRVHPHSMLHRMRRVITEPTRLRRLPRYIAYRLNLLTTDRWIDRTLGIRTCTIYNQQDPELATHSIPSQPVPYRHLRLIMENMPEDSPRHFIDIGCGVGRACFYAAHFGPFTSVSGIDFDNDLIMRAEANRCRFTNRRDVALHFLKADAREYLLPNERFLVFLCNPFDEYVLSTFIANNLNHFLKQESVLVYSNNIHDSVLVHAGLTRIPLVNSREISSWVLLP